MPQTDRQSEQANKAKLIHPLFVRVAHWINAFAAIAMLMSGLRIYNASPLFGFRFSPDLTLGGWLGGALAWHFAMMWLLVANGFFYVIYGIFSGHFFRRIFRFAPIAAYRNVRLEARRLLFHGTGEYNLAQRVLYVAVVVDFAVLILSGAAMWKPLQFHALAEFLGGYDSARYIHFFGMVFLAAFLFVHVIMALAIDGVIKSMFTGRLAKRLPAKPDRPRG